jgi:hypothetical protein
VTQNSVGEGEVLVTLMPGKRVLERLRRNFRNGVPALSATKIPLHTFFLSFDEGNESCELNYSLV